MSDTLFAAIIGAITGGIIGICAIYYGNRLTLSTAMKTIRTTEFSKAAATFHCAFTEEIRLLSIIHPGHSPEFQKTYDILRTAYIKHQNAVIRFGAYLSDPCLTVFKTKWKEYCCYNEQSQQATFSEYITGVSHTDELRVRNLAVSRIKALLKIADPLKK